MLIILLLLITLINYLTFFNSIYKYQIQKENDFFTNFNNKNNRKEIWK